MPKVYCQLWEESELRWGVRPDGYSLHSTLENVNLYIKAYWLLQKRREPTVPHEYSRPCGKPYLAEVDDATFTKIGEKLGIRSYERNAPKRLEIDTDECG